MSRGSHASRLAMSWMAEDDPPRWRDVDGSWVLVDLSGFTRLTERLTDSGAEGVEVLHGALGRCFEALLGGSMELGGDVLGFAGDAALLQFVGCDEQAWHAGASQWRGRQGCNDFSVGIELEGLEGLCFEPRQYEVLLVVLRALAARYPIAGIAGHEHVAPGRKRDPGAGFDWALVRAGMGWPARYFPESDGRDECAADALPGRVPPR